ncbi:MAG: DUF2027 domain-containing protein [Defluviitaleaceae bacterium]|nr:DUF2027 domain-containing protein [Defluviitaleaceae bacterium]
MEIRNIPIDNARKQEISQLREEILNLETYVDLTPFGLGIYKLRNEGDGILWDITTIPSTVGSLDGVELVFGHEINRKDDETWDNAWGNSNKGKDVLYDIVFYDDTYIIITPLWDNHGALYYWGYVYLCKEIKAGADLFSAGILDPDIVYKLRELPREQISRLELAEKLGKEF